MKKLDWILDKIETSAFVIFLSVMTIDVFVQVIFLYIIKASIPWSEELARYCMVYTVFFGVSAGLRVGAHTGVDAFLMVFPRKVRYYIVLLEKIICTLLCAAFFCLSTQLTVQLFQGGQTSPTLFIPMGFAYMAMPIGFFGGMIRCVQNLIEHVFLKKKTQNA